VHVYLCIHVLYTNIDRSSKVVHGSLMTEDRNMVLLARDKFNDSIMQLN
jgi:hypothetical protein